MTHGSQITTCDWQQQFGLTSGHFIECWNPVVYGFAFGPLALVITSNPFGSKAS